MRIYRGIPTKYRHLPMVPSALRPNEIKHMEEEILQAIIRFAKENGEGDVAEAEKRTGKSIYDSFNELMNEYKKNFINKRKKGPYADVTDHAVYCLFLSTCYLYICFEQNPILANQLMLKENFNLNQYRDKNGKFDIDRLYSASRRFPIRLFNTTVEQVYGKSPKELSGENYEFIYLSEIGRILSLMEPWSNLQHLNYNLRESNDYNLFPTMVMDWTHNIDIARSFAKYQEDPGVVVSIDLDMYERFIYTVFYEGGIDPYTVVSAIKLDKVGAYIFGFRNVSPYLAPRKMEGGYIVGCGRYTEERFKEVVNMQNQMGVTIFWPWEYTIPELLKNKLGFRLGFEALQW